MALQTNPAGELALVDIRFPACVAPEALAPLRALERVSARDMPIDPAPLAALPKLRDLDLEGATPRAAVAWPGFEA